MSQFRFGFAAGSEAAAVPPRRGVLYMLGYAPFGAAFGPIRLRIEPEPRAAPHIRRQSRNLRRG
jgi:hypothetical protein